MNLIQVSAILKAERGSVGWFSVAAETYIDTDLSIKNPPFFWNSLIYDFKKVQIYFV